MKKIRAIIAILLSCSLLFSACTTVSSEKSHVDDTSVQETQVDDSLTGVEDQQDTNSSSEDSDDPDKENNDEIGTVEDEQIPDFYGMNDPALLQYVEDTVYAGLVRDFSSEDYVIEDVEAIYYSEDYLQEVAFNSKSNIYFGYTLAELDEQFQGQRYVFTLGDDGKTIVTPFEAYDDTYDRVIRNVAIGTGVILICVTVSVVTAGTGTAPTVSLIFAAAAKTGTEFALSSAVISGVASGVITGIQTKDFDKALKAAALNGSESFKWGAISGVIVGGATEAITLSRATAIEVTDNNIKSFERIAKKYNVDFAVKKDKTVQPPKYMVFFKAKDTDVLSQAFKEFVKVNEKQKAKASVRSKLKNFMKQVAQNKNRERTRDKQKSRGQSL